MKTEDCNRLPLSHGPHSWHPDGDWVDESYHNRYCNGDGPRVLEPEPSIIRLHRLIGRPYKLGSLVTGRQALTEAEYLVRNLKKQLRTRDRKITKLTRENRDLNKQIETIALYWDIDLDKFREDWS